MLDKKKPYGEVHGNAAYAFEQNDKFYNAQGYEVSETGKEIEETPEKAAKLAAEEAEKKAAAEKLKDPRVEKAKEVEAMTVDAIKLKLDGFDVKYDKSALKADLVTMLVDEELSD